MNIRILRSLTPPPPAEEETPSVPSPWRRSSTGDFNLLPVTVLRKKEDIRQPRPGEKCVHVVLVVVILCLFLLWWFHRPVSLGDA